MVEIISFKDYQSDRKAFKESLSSSGFSAANLKSNYSDIVMYVSDSRETGVLVFGFSLSELSSINQSEYLSWPHIVQVWEIIANPELGFDEIYKKNAIQYIIKSLPVLKSWKILVNEIASKEKGLTTHLFVEIDRDNINEPNSIHICQSPNKILNEKSANKIKANTENLV